MRHTFLVVTVKRRLKSVYIYGSYRKIKTGVPLFGSVCEDFVILVCVVLTQCQRVTDRRTDNPTVVNTGLCIASYADAL